MLSSRAGRLLVLLTLTLSLASAAHAASRTYTLAGSFDLIAGATGNVVGYPTDPRLLPSMTPVGGFTANTAGSLTVDLASGELLGFSLAVEDASFDLDATYHIPGLPAPPHGTISNSDMAHGATGGEIGAVAPGEIDFASGVNFDLVSGTASCSSPFGALFCQNDSIGPFYDVDTGEISAVGQSNPFVIEILPNDSIAVSVVFDSGIVTGDAQAVQTLTLTGSSASTPPVPALGAWAMVLLAGALAWAASHRLQLGRPAGR